MIFKKQDEKENSPDTQENATFTCEQKKWRTIAICAVIALMLIAVVIYFIVKETPKEVNVAKEALDNVLLVLEEDPDNTTEEIPDFLVEAEERNGYEIISFEETETGAVAMLRVYSPDLYGIAKELDKNTYADEAELLAAINAAVKEAELVEKQIILEFEKTDDGYVPIITSEFLDALYGGVFRLYDDLINAEN